MPPTEMNVPSALARGCQDAERLGVGFGELLVVRLHP